jgi:hypothetical protein
MPIPATSRMLACGGLAIVCDGLAWTDSTRPSIF